VIWQVLATRDRVRRRLENYLQQGGHQVIRQGCVHPEARLATVRAVVELTDMQAEILEAMVQCDSAQEIADRLHISRDSVYDHVRALMLIFGVSSRHRVLMEALRLGVLELSGRTGQTRD
jgi:DNA-binding CsgD family transcriptional regulator